MSARYAVPMPVVGLATRTSSGAGTGVDVGEFLEGQLHVLVKTRGGTTPTLRIWWQSSFNGGNGITGGRYVNHTAVATYSNATGHKMSLLTNIGKYGKLAWTFGGSSPSFQFQAHVVGKI